MANCCNSKIYPLGSPNCKFNFGIIRGIIFVDYRYINDVSYYNTQGTPNVSYMLSQGVAVATPKLYNVTAEKPESKTQEFEDGTIFKIAESARRINGVIPQGTFWQLGALKKLGCKKLGIYLIDNNGNLLGQSHFTDTTSYLYPILIDNESIDAIFQFATDSSVSQISVSLQINSLVKDEDFAVTDETDYTSVITNPYTFVIPLNATVNLTTSTASLTLYYHNNLYRRLYITPDDVATPITLSGINKTTNSAASINVTISSYNSGSGLFSFNITGSTGLSSGDTFEIRSLTGLLDPFRDLFGEFITVVVS